MLNKMTPHSVCVLYDPKDGRIVHTHQIAFAGTPHDIPDAEVEATARERAVGFGHKVDSLHALRVAGEDCDGVSPYRVDLRTKKLHKVPKRAWPDGHKEAN